MQPAFFHDGAFSRLEGAIRHHLDVRGSVPAYNPAAAGVAADLVHVAPTAPLLDRADPLVREPLHLTAQEFDSLVEFVRDGLLDPRTTPAHLCSLIPAVVASGRPVAVFQGCK